MKKWTSEKAHSWYREAGVIRGCNYLPRTAVNMTEMWQAPTFDPETIDQELGWAAAAGYNSVRIFLQYLVWEDDPEGLKERMDRFLSIASRHGVSAMVILFCDCFFGGRDPYLGPQDGPVPGVHNSQWVPSPGFERLADRNAWPGLERYVKDIVGSFGSDPRVLVWDLYNEPDDELRSQPLVEDAFAWARSASPMQPLTTGPWTWNAFEDDLSSRLFELSDVVTFHYYGAAEDIGPSLARCHAHGRPVICTEWLRRHHGNTFAEMLPVFAENRIGWYNWGLVAGRTQTYLAWESKQGDPTPAVWQHDMMHPDGTPLDPGELDLIRRFDFTG